MEKINQFFFFLVGTTLLWGQQFTDITQTAGVEHHFEVFEGMFGGGVAVLDFNNDGFEDLYLTGGLQDDQLLQNNGDGTFSNQFKNSGLELLSNYATQGVVAADFNRDGWKDLFITTITQSNLDQKIPRAQNFIFLNQGNGTFQDKSNAFKIDKAATFSTGAAVGDFNLDGYPDLYVGNYFTEYEGGLKEISDATIVNAGKTAKGFLYENKNGKKFSNVYSKYGLKHRGFSFGGIFTDFDNDADLDLLINNDFGYKAKPNYLLENKFPKKQFDYVAKEKQLDLRINAMGAATADINNDGWLDYFITNIRFNMMMVSQSDSLTYQNQLEALGMQHFAISWGANFADFDQDGDVDLFVSNGDLNPNCQAMYNFYFENIGTGFIEKSGAVGLKDYGIGRGSAVFDLENDGDLDLVVINQAPTMPYGPPSITRIYRNDLTKGNYLKIKLIGKAATPSGFGARVRLYANDLHLQQEIDGGNSSHLSHNSTLAHFGLGAHTIIDSLVVTWPGGHQQKKYNLPVNQLVTIIDDRPFKKSFFDSQMMWIIGLGLLLIGLLLVYKKFKNRV